MNKLSVISFISYDHKLLLESLATYIDAVDEVILGLDAKRLNLRGGEFHLPATFFDDLKALDKQSKVKIVEQDFYVAGSSPNDLCTSERNVLSTHTTEGAWIISLDADETIFNLDETVNFLRSFDEKRVTLFGRQIVLLKREGELLFVIENSDRSKDDLPFAIGRQNGFTLNKHADGPIAFAPVLIVHNSWARTAEELDSKLQYRSDFANKNFRAFLESLNEASSAALTNLHPTHPELWERVKIVRNGLDNYADEQLDRLYKDQAWRAAAIHGRLNLFEQKIIARDANIAELKAEHARTVASLNAAHESKLASFNRSYKEMKMQLDAEIRANKARSERSS